MMEDLFKIIIQDELDKETVPRNGTNTNSVRCPIKDCKTFAGYRTCYLDLYVCCYIFKAKYEQLNPEQRKILLQ